MKQEEEIIKRDELELNSTSIFNIYTITYILIIILLIVLTLGFTLFPVISVEIDILKVVLYIFLTDFMAISVLILSEFKVSFVDKNKDAEKLYWIYIFFCFILLAINLINLDTLDLFEVIFIDVVYMIALYFSKFEQVRVELIRISAVIISNFIQSLFLLDNAKLLIISAVLLLLLNNIFPKIFEYLFEQFCQISSADLPVKFWNFIVTHYMFLLEMYRVVAVRLVVIFLISFFPWFLVFFFKTSYLVYMLTFILLFYLTLVTTAWKFFINSNKYAYEFLYNSMEFCDAVSFSIKINNILALSFETLAPELLKNYDDNGEVVEKELWRPFFFLRKLIFVSKISVSQLESEMISYIDACGEEFSTFSQTTFVLETVRMIARDGCLNQKNSFFYLEAQRIAAGMANSENKYSAYFYGVCNIFIRNKENLNAAILAIFLERDKVEVECPYVDVVPIIESSFLKSPGLTMITARIFI